jgi:hypothetical protein
MLTGELPFNINAFESMPIIFNNIKNSTVDFSKVKISH